MSTADACANACCAASAHGCLFFTLNAGSGPRDCYLKSSRSHRRNPGCISGVVNGTAPPTPAPPPPVRMLDAVKDCGCDPTGASDTTALLQACIDRAYARTLPRVPVLLPAGTYLVSSTLTLKQPNLPGDHDGINICPARFLPHILVGEPTAAQLHRRSTAAARRPVLRLAPHSAGFGAGQGDGKPVIDLGKGGDNMNMLLKGVDVDLTLPGNPAACGVGDWGAQGSTVTDVAVRASNETFACFCGMNGSGGMYANVEGRGARYGVFIEGSCPVPSSVGLALSGQGVSAVHFVSQETLSLVGANISVPAWATGPAIAQSGGGGKGMSLVDVAIECEGGAAAAQVAVDAASFSLYARDLYVRGCAKAVVQAGAAPLRRRRRPAAAAAVDGCT